VHRPYVCTDDRLVVVDGIPVRTVPAILLVKSRCRVEELFEDWSGEAAVIEREMKRFREWAHNKVDAMLREKGSWAPAWEWGLVVCQNQYETRWIGALLFPHDRLVYSPEEDI
jgi:hypothetical protein